MADQPVVRRATRRVFDGRLVRLDVDTVRTPDGHEHDLEVVRHPGAAAVVPLLSDPGADDPSVLLIRQYRHVVAETIWEIPAGTLEPGEEPRRCAERELLEETGARADRLDHLTTIWTTPGFTDERIHLYLATGIRVEEPAPRPDESMTVEPRPLSTILEMIRDGALVDAKSIVALLYVAGYRLNF